MFMNMPMFSLEILVLSIETYSFSMPSYTLLNTHDYPLMIKLLVFLEV